MFERKEKIKYCIMDAFAEDIVRDQYFTIYDKFEGRKTYEEISNYIKYKYPDIDEKEMGDVLNELREHNKLEYNNNIYKLDSSNLKLEDMSAFTIRKLRKTLIHIRKDKDQRY